MSEEHEVKFGVLTEHGGVTEVRAIKQSALAACPHVIFMPDHYRSDGSCRCDDPNHHEMAEWGYTWDGKAWT